MRIVLICLLLVCGCVSWQPTVWEMGMEHSEFVAKNDKLNLWRATADTIVYRRADAKHYWNRVDTLVYKKADAYYYWNRKPFHWYVFSNGKLIEVSVGTYRPRPHP